MAFVTTEIKEKVEKIVENMEDFATLADDNTGMGMPSDAENFRRSASEVNDGLFKLLVMGKFKNGKSTFVNAIVSKSMMAAKATATTAVIATVSLGDDEDSVDIFYTDPRKNKRISLELFNREFALTPEDQDLIDNGGNCDRFADVNHVEMHSRDELFQDGVTLIDSPGLEEANSRTLTTYEYVPRANAIIFTLSATSLFSAKEREYIQENFVGKHLRNVFFVINRIDNLNEGELEASIIPSVRANLTSVFTDEKGNFDEALYNRRVFFTNAYGALRLRTGKPTQVIVDGEVKSLTLEDTGLPKFEAALRDFLSSEERVNATFQSTLTNMSNTYQRAREKAQSEKAARLLPLAELEKNRMAAEVKMKQAEDTVESMRTSIQSTASLIAQKIYLDLLSFVDNNLKSEFASVVENGDTKFGAKEMFQLAKIALLGGDQSKIIQPLSGKIESYISMQLETWSKRVPTLAAADTEQLQKDLNASIGDFSISLSEAMHEFSGGSMNPVPLTNGKGGATTGIQAAIAAIGFGDASILLDVTASGGLQWADFIKKICMQYVVQLAVVLATGPFAIPALIATEIFQMQQSGKKMGKDMLLKIGKDSFESVKNQIMAQEMELKDRIKSQFVDQCEGMLTAAKKLVDDTRKSQQRIVEEHSKGEANAKAENDRQDKVIADMRTCVENVYEQMYNRRPSEDEIAKLAVSKGKKSA